MQVTVGIESNKQESKTGRSPWVSLGILSVIGFLIMYVEMMVAPAIPDFIRDFNISYSSVSWILSSYMISAAVSTPILGKLSDVYGRKKILVIGLSIYALAVFASGFATNIEFMVITRIIQGIGIGIFPIAMSIIRNEFSKKRIGIAQGVITTMFGSGATVGLAVGGIITEYLGWRATFFTIVPIPIILVILIIILLEEKPILAKINGESSFSLDLKGLITLSIAITSFIAAFSFLSNGNDLVTSYVLISVGIVSSVLFAIVEKKIKLPLIEPRLLFDRTLFASNLLRMSSGVIMFMLLQTIPVLVRDPKPLGFGGAASSAAFLTLPMTVTYLVVGLSIGFALYRIGNLRVSIAGGILGFAGFAYLYFGDLNTFPLVLILLGAAMQLMHMGGLNLNLVSAPKEHTGISFGISNVFYLTGCAFGPALAALFMESHLVSIHNFAAKFPSQESYHLIFATGIGISLIATMVPFWVMKMKKKSNETNLDHSGSDSTVTT